MTKRRKKKKRHKEISLKRDRNFVEGFATSKYRNVQIGFPQRLEGQLNHEEQTTEPKQTDVDMAKHACQVFDHMPIREKGKSKKKKKRRWKNLSKNNKRDSKGKRKSVWHLDCEVEFWKHRCIKTRTFSKMETLKSLLKKKPADAKTNISFETPQASNPMLSRLYLADNSVFPRYDHLKPLLALKETRNSQSNTKPTKAEKTLPKISDAKWNNSKAVGSKLNSGNKQLDGQPNLTSSNSKEIFEKPDELKGMVMRNRDTHRESVKRAIKGQRGRRARKRSHGKLRRWKYKPGKCFILVSYIPPLLEGGGKLEVWDVDGKAKTPLPKEDMGKLYSGDCYLVLYTYHSGERKDEYFLCCWFGKRSIQKDQVTEIRLANAMSNSLKVRHVQGHIYEGKEPPQFVAFFQPMMVLHGGLSSRYKNIIEENGLQDKTYTPESMALIQVSGTGVHNNKAVPVELVATSLNSYECFLRKSGTSMFPWHGNQSAHEQLELAAKVAEVLKSGITLKHAKEGTESSTFWSAFGEKQNFICKKASSETVRDPHLFSFSFNIGKFQVEEIHNFAQDDLFTEDIYLLDTHAEVFVWVGQRVDPKEKQTVFEIGQKYVDLAGSLEGLSPKVPLYKVNEGNEPCFFTTDFSWDHTKAIVQGNSFQKNSVMLFGTHYVGEEKSNSGNQGPRQRGEALAALKSAFNSSGSRTTYLSQDRPNKSQEGPRQRAEAFAALLSAFKWKDQPDYDCSWEWKSKMKDHFTLEDKVGFKGEGIDTSEAKCPPILYQY